MAGVWSSFVENVTPANGSTIVMSARTTVPTSAVAANETEAQPVWSVTLLPGADNGIIPGSVLFSAAGKVFYDRDGKVYTDFNAATGAGTEVGTINYATSVVTFSAYVAAAPTNVQVLSMLAGYGNYTATYAAFRTSGAPLRAGSLYLQVTGADGVQITATSDASGNLIGSHLRGTVNAQTGVVYVEFGDMVTAAGNEGQPWYNPANVVGGQIFAPREIYPDTLRYNAVVQTSIPLDATLLGINPVRLPSDGRVPIFRKGNAAVLRNVLTTPPTVVSNGQTVNTGRTRLSRLRVLGANGTEITSGVTADLDLGTVTFTNVTGYSQPVRVEHTVEDMVLLTDVQIDGTLRSSRALTHDYPMGSHIASALLMGDLQARVSLLFDQQTWVDNSWSNTLSGSAAPASYNDALYPIDTTNRGTITERWVVRFTATTTFQVIGEHVGVIAVGDINTDCAPLNPANGTPYFSIPYQGWGAGWAAGNVLRFNTIGAIPPVWIARTVQQGPSAGPSDSFTLVARGDVNRP